MIRASCKCTSVLATRGGSIVCASCGAGIVTDRSDDGSLYNSASPATLPPDATKRTFCTFLRTHKVPGAVKLGRVWTVPRHAWHAARAKATAKPAKLRLVSTIATDAADDEAALAARFLAAAGERPTKRQK